MLAVAAALGLAGIAPSSDAEAQTLLGTAESFGVLAGSTVTNTGSSVIQGNVGVSPGSAITGFPPGIVVPPGTIHGPDGVSGQAQIDLTTAYNTLMALPFSVDLTGVDLGGLVLNPAVYHFANSAQLTGMLTLNGQGNTASQFVFQIGSTLTTASGSSVLLINGANGNNVYWAVGSSATLGTGTSFQGNIIALTSITLNTGATLNCGRALARNGAVTLDTNTITLCVPTPPGPTPPGPTPPGPTPTPLTPDQAAKDISLNQLFGEGVSGTQQTSFNASRLFSSAMLAQAVFWGGGTGPYFPGTGFGPRGASPSQRPEKYQPLKLGPSGEEPQQSVGFYQPRRWRLWAAGLGGSDSLDGDNGTANLDSNIGGAAIGLDYQINHTALVGIAGGYTKSWLSVDQMNTDGTVQGAHVGLYGIKTFGPLYLAGTAEYTRFDNQTQRTIDWIVDERANASFNSDSFGGRFEAGWRMEFGRDYVTPFAGVDGFNLRSGNFAEKSRGANGDAGILGLAFDSESVSSLESSVGVQFDTQIPLANDRLLTPFVRAAWVHEFDPDRVVGASLILSPAAALTLNGASAAEDAARVDAGLKLDLSERIALFGYFEGEFARREQAYAGVGGGDGAFYGSGEGQNYAGHFGMRVAW
ncbi:MAG: ice-binding family protein [Isosphaeraceae bacterium]